MDSKIKMLPAVTLKDVFAELSCANNDCCDVVVSGISEDSREVAEGYIFVARDGEYHKGTDYIATAIAMGAVAVIIDKQDKLTPDIDTDMYSVPLIAVSDLTNQLGNIAAKVFANVIETLQIIGVTGTNGKTSCAHYIAQALNYLDTPTYMIGTLGNGHPERLQEAQRTTPDACRLHTLFADFYQQGAKVVVMEVSSHALEQGRVAAVPFYIGAFTNLSRDHLDYHGCMAHYGRAKSRLFTDFKLKHGILNLDDEYNSQLYTQLKKLDDTQYQTTLTTFTEQDVSVANNQLVASALNLEHGIAFDLAYNNDVTRIETQLIGKFNVANLLLVSAVLLKMAVSSADIQQSFKRLKPVPGRMQSVVLNQKNAQPLCIVDYAHTPDALEKALSASRVHCAGRLIVVFGCGGDRDTGKRQEMAAIAQQFADIIVVTSDNPRTENPDAIINMIEQGFSANVKYVAMSDRKRAIDHAIAIANATDVVLVAGKGHEDYQDVLGVKHKFSDAKVIVASLAEKEIKQLNNEQSKESV